MNDIAIRARDLRKIYRLYSKPSYRFLDIFGLLPARPGAYSEHAALAGVSLEITRGEKVAIIGRNGAGKSTLLKLITRVIEPTSGSIEVNAKVHALLQIGTGFHPDFTGRENVYAYLAQLGVSRQAADRLCEEIIEFAEIEEYIDQPVKTYSTGMAVRLMFSTSTAIRPDLLVLDEVLGVGDAYFTQKSFERIQELCRDSGTTLLLVTHDLYSAMNLCSRFIWVERGKVLADGPSRQVLQAYESSIREQEEQRLRLKRLAMLKRTEEVERALFAQLQTASRQPPSSGLAIASIRLITGERVVAELDTADAERASGLALELSPGVGNWSDVTEVAGRACRLFSAHGSLFHRLPFLIRDPDAVAAVESGAASLELIVFSEEQGDHLQALVSGTARETFAASMALDAPGRWVTTRAALTSGGADAQIELGDRMGRRYGSRMFEIVQVTFMDETGRETAQFDVGATMRVALRFRLNDQSFRQRPTIIIAFQKDGITRTHRFWTDAIAFDATERSEGSLEVVAAPCLLGAGTYLVTVSVFAEGHFQTISRHSFFSANPNLLDMHARAYEIVVHGSPTDVLANDVVFQHPAEWLRDGIVVAQTPIVRSRPSPAMSGAE